MPRFRLAILLAALLALGSSRGDAAPAGAVRFDLAGDPGSLNPLFAHADAGANEQQIDRLLFDPFIDIDERGRSVPILLREIPDARNGGISRDGRTLTYRLRPDARWSDGQPVTAADVLFTLKAILDPRNPVRQRSGYELIDRMGAPDAHTVVLHLKSAWAPAVATFFSYGTAPQYVLPAHAFRAPAPLERDAFNAKPIGDGPYTLVSWKRGDRLRFAANARYWRRAVGAPALDVRIVPDPNTNLTLLRSGEIDWNLVAPSQRPALAGATNLTYRTVPLALVAGVALNTSHPPLDDVRVRRAIAASIDRAAISAKITLGQYPVVDTDQPLASWAHDPSAKLPAYDPAAADRLLDAAGWRRGDDGVRVKAGHRLALTYVQFPESTTGVRTATVIQQALRARGLDVALKSVANAQLFLPQTGLLAQGQFDLAYIPWQMGADPDDSFLLACHGSANVMRWCNRDVDRLEGEALNTSDRSRRRALYAQIQQITAREVPIVFLFNPAYLYAVDRRLAGFAPNAFSPTWNAAAWSLRP